jgi:RHS repeat-associated protein
VRWSASGGTLPTDFTFTGQRSESFGLMDYQARYYDPVLGRFVQTDTLVPSPSDPQSLNRYSYVGNNPTKYRDPSGHVRCMDGECNLVDNPVTGELDWRGPVWSLPNTRYYLSEVYGYFDRSHLNTGRPTDIIADVKQAIADGGGAVRVPEMVSAARGKVWFRYIGTYQISSDAKPEDALGIAFGIYQDWGHRFEEWEGSFALGRGNDTSFAIEDLPSHYIGFFIAATGLSREEAFAILGSVRGTSQEPTRNTKNRTYNPWVDDNSVPWPALVTSLMPTPIASGTNTWEFVSGSCEGFACNLVSDP